MKTHKKITCTLLSICAFSSFYTAFVVQRSYGGIWDPYHTKEELIGMFKTLCDAHSECTSYESVGKTYEGRDIWIFKIGNSEGGKVLWDGQLHGNEDKGSEILYLIAAWLLESDDPEAERILERNHVLFIPVVNMDSYERGNRHFYSGCQWGVDLNRNFQTGWRSAECSDIYPGPNAASEPETQVSRSVFQTYRPYFYVNLHMGVGPFAWYCSRGNVTLAHEVINKTRELGSEMGVTPYPTGGIGSTGFAIGDAGSFGISSWLVETDRSWKHTEENWREIVEVYYPKCRIMFIAMCELCESGERATDLNKDGIVNILDVAIVATAFGTKEGDTNYNQIADLDDNKEINIIDVSIVAMDYGKMA